VDDLKEWDLKEEREGLEDEDPGDSDNDQEEESEQEEEEQEESDDDQCVEDNAVDDENEPDTEEQYQQLKETFEMAIARSGHSECEDPECSTCRDMAKHFESLAISESFYDESVTVENRPPATTKLNSSRNIRTPSKRRQANQCSQCLMPNFDTVSDTEILTLCNTCIVQNSGHSDCEDPECQTCLRIAQVLEDRSKSIMGTPSIKRQADLCSQCLQPNCDSVNGSDSMFWLCNNCIVQNSCHADCEHPECLTCLRIAQILENRSNSNRAIRATVSPLTNIINYSVLFSPKRKGNHGLDEFSEDEHIVIQYDPDRSNTIEEPGSGKKKRFSLTRTKN
jgi:hypothetical protein